MHDLRSDHLNELRAQLAVAEQGSYVAAGCTGGGMQRWSPSGPPPWRAGSASAWSS